MNDFEKEIKEIGSYLDCNENELRDEIKKLMESCIDREKVIKVLDDAVKDANDKEFSLRIDLIKHDLNLRG